MNDVSFLEGSGAEFFKNAHIRAIRNKANILTVWFFSNLKPKTNCMRTGFCFR